MTKTTHPVPDAKPQDKSVSGVTTSDSSISLNLGEWVFLSCVSLQSTNQGIAKGPVPQVAGSIDLSQVRRGRGRAPQKTVRPTPTPCPVTWLETLHNQFLCAVIFLDETESLVRVYERESQDDISDNPSPQDNPPAATPRYVELPSIDPLRSFPSPASPLFPRLYSQTSAETPSSPTKRRKLTDSDVHYSPTASHHSTSFDVSLAQFTNPQDGLLKSPNENRSELHSSHTNVDPGFDVSCTGLSPTYVDIAVWPLGDIKEAKLMRYFVDHLSVWVRLPSSNDGSLLIN